MKKYPLAAAIGLMAMGSVAVQAAELRFASGYPQGSITSDALGVFEERLDELSGGDVSVRVFELSLLNLRETPAGIRDGMADMGVVLTPYFPADFPHTNMVAEVSMSIELTERGSSQAGLVYTGAMSEFIFSECTECRDEFAAQNQLFLGSAATPPYSLLCREKVDSLEALEGKNLRTSGAQWARWAESVGANPITMSVNEIYEGLSQGVVDCSVQSTSELSVFNLFEVVDDITVNYPSGTFSGVGSANINLDSWRSLNEEQRQALLEATSVLSAEFSWGYEKGAVDNERTAEEQGIGLTQPSEAMVEKNREFIREDLKTIASAYEERYGIQNADEKIERFRELLGEWRERIDGVESSEELADLYWEHVFSKVDVSQYGQ
ncbi:TRAP-type C4-dicarboxylate transport system, substrate-binding protein [Marinobacter segnicrescens]|uniref:TRAP-type C4-dicarboxylate transport system, substrate-binding protein n=1 Tax=Marinobacter segnicrescens TaxID=430453 RepID=A0A1H9Z6R1_9GAMM|nr:C4-dicarboxylate TRAP transporter substrate-binding protein [Marinobacter segnicrescens]SES77033.1 TRAP-type C4-dicarboxylate transport system, substrate-binding protein [Marinobacter segnicrescens]